MFGQNLGDSPHKGTYAQLMAESGAFLILTIDTKEPIEVGAFVGEFTSLANQYEKFFKEKYPDAEGNAEVFVTQVDRGSIVAHLLPYWPVGALAAAWGTLEVIDRINTLDEFVRRWGGRIDHYFKKDGRVPDATRGDIKDFHNAVAAIARDPNATLKLEAAYYEDGKQNVKAAFKFNTAQAKIAEQEIDNHKKEIEATGSADYQKALLIFVRPDIRSQETGKRSGELAMIEAIFDKPRPVIYVSNLAEQRIKSEMRDDDSIFKKGFVADVNVEMRRGKPCAYRITNLHQVIDLPDD